MLFARWRGRLIDRAKAATGRYTRTRSECSTTAVSCVVSGVFVVRRKKLWETPSSTSTELHRRLVSIRRHVARSLPHPVRRRSHLGHVTAVACRCRTAAVAVPMFTQTELFPNLCGRRLQLVLRAPLRRRTAHARCWVTWPDAVVASGSGRLSRYRVSSPTTR